MNKYFKYAIILLAAATIYRCGTTGTEPTPTPTFILSNADEDIVLVIQNNSVSTMLSVRLSDGNGNVIDGRQIDFTASPATAVLTPASALTNEQGKASTTVMWSVDDGSITVDATVSGTAISIRLLDLMSPSEIVALNIVSGNEQIGEPGMALKEPLIVEARNIDGNPIQNALITFSNESNAVSFTKEKVLTGEDGRAETFAAINDVVGMIPIVARLNGNEEISAAFNILSLGEERILYVTRKEPAGIYVMNPDGSGQVNVFDTPTFIMNADWSPDGNRIVYVSADDQLQTFGLYTIKFDGSDKRLLYTMNDYYDGPSWSPSGDLIAFSRGTSWLPNVHLYTIKVDGTDLQKLTSGDWIVNYSPAWLPDGSKIIFTRDEELYTINADGTGLSLIFDGDSQLQYVRANLSPNLKKLLFLNGHINEGWDIFVANPDGSDAIALTSRSENVRDPSWSPNGRKIIYSGGGHILIMNVDGTNKVNFPNDRGGVVSPKWVRKK